MDKRVADDIKRLAQTPPGVQPLPQAPVPDPRPAITSTGRNTAAAAEAGGPIASPLTELSRTTQVTQAVSSDGLFAWTVPHEITMQDANGREVVFSYAAP